MDPEAVMVLARLVHRSYPDRWKEEVQVELELELGIVEHPRWLMLLMSIVLMWMQGGYS